MLRTIVITLSLLIAGPLTLTGCEDEPTEKIENGLEEIGEGIEDSVDEAGENLEEAGEEIEEEVQ